ncbi:MAG: bifunctional folylpolyglutamate synthase/dihydrofolate synthase [Candidatus ainarchaeum sp.]|nr:bifunctional folylpolyglutamate synthase/dihydrofolate synthase [Candidatus ainarchaeum sp.]
MDVLDEVLALPRKMGPGDLGPMGRLVGEAGNPQNRFKAVVVGGTNGKGSITAMVSSILASSGFRTGAYYSPHVDCIGERIRVGGENIPEEDIARIFAERVKPVIAGGLEVSFFEAMTAIAFHYFAEQEVDYAVLEVGLGGRFDATNVADPRVSVVATVDLEHTEILGGSIARIAAEKVEILRKGGTLVTNEDKDEAMAVFVKACAEKGAELLRVGRDARAEKLACDDKENVWRIRSRHGEYVGRLKLLGEHQAGNAAAAVLAAEALREPGITRESIERGLRGAFLPARVEVVSRNPLVVMDGAHNPAAMRALARALRLFPHKRAVLAIGMMADKDIGGTVREIAPLCGRIFVNKPNVPRAATPEAIAGEARKYCPDVEIVPDVRESYARAVSSAGEGGMVVLAGSIYMVSEARGKDRLGLCQ